MNPLPQFPLTASDCWAQRDYILLTARILEASEHMYNRVEKAKDGTELLTILTQNAWWVNSRLYVINQLPEPSEIPGLTSLDCMGCTGLATLLEYPNLTRMYCCGCTSLTTLPEYPNLTMLDCAGCTGLTVLPEYPSLTNLDCWGCTGLIALPKCPKLIRLDCLGCTGLTVLPEYPNLTMLHCPPRLR